MVVVTGVAVVIVGCTYIVLEATAITSDTDVVVSRCACVVVPVSIITRKKLTDYEGGGKRYHSYSSLANVEAAAAVCIYTSESKIISQNILRDNVEF